MKYIAITFDDGRSDNYLLAKHIMDKYNLCGTVYITTGFIDGSWKGYSVLGSPTRPLTKEEIIGLYKSGWEIGLHGDKHITEIEDTRNAINKLQSWGIENDIWGISIPNSKVDETSIFEILNSDYGDKITYIRRGRTTDMSKFSNKVLFGLYSILKFKKVYRVFNNLNIVDLNNINKNNIPSVVIKSNDSPMMIIDFIKKARDESVIVLMFHSILSSENSNCGRDAWSLESEKFDLICKELNALIEDNTIMVSPLMEFLKGDKK